MKLRILSIALIMLISGCSLESDDKKTMSSAPVQPVDVAQVLYQPYTPEHTFTSRLESPQQVEIRPRVSGVIEAVQFTEGSRVKKGDLLFKIDPRPFAAEVKRLQAQLSSAKTALQQAQSEATRAKRLKSRNAISAEQAESRLFLASQRRSELASVQAALEAARLNLEFTEVRAPISGSISSAFITSGNNVQAGVSVLTTLVATDQLYAYIGVDERTWNTIFAEVTSASKTPATLTLAGMDKAASPGVIDFIDNQVDSHTGTLRVRAVFNAEGQPSLRPGAFARVTLSATEARDRIMVPDRAVGTDLKNRFVLTVNPENTLEYRSVTLGERIGELRVITDGLSPEDIIAVNGPARVGPGMPVSPRTVTIASQASPAVTVAANERH